MNANELETCCCLYGKDLRAYFSSPSITWDEPGGQEPIAAVTPENKAVYCWMNKNEAWNEITEQIGKRAAEKCQSLPEGIWRLLGKKPLEVFIGWTAEQDAHQWLLLNDNLGNVLRNAVRESGLSMKQAAEKADVNRISLMRFMDGRSDLNLSSASKLAKFFGFELVIKNRRRSAG